MLGIYRCTSRTLERKKKRCLKRKIIESRRSKSQNKQEILEKVKNQGKKEDKMQFNASF